MAAEGNGRVTPDIRCLAMFPQGNLPTADEEQLLTDAARQGALTVLCGDAGDFPAHMPGAYRTVGGEDPVGEVIALCAREGIAQGDILLCREGMTERLPGKPRDWRTLPGTVIDRVKREIRQKSMDAAALSRVSGAEKRRLLAACKGADKGGKRLLIVSQMAAFDKGSCDYLKKMLALTPKDSVLHLSETPALSMKTLRDKLSTPFHRARWAAFPAGYPLRVTGEISGEAPRAVQAAAENLALRFPELGNTGALALGLYLHDLFTLALDAFKPHAVLMWNAFTAAHMILDDLARKRGVQVIYMEFGVLPGTINLDMRGQMGASSMAQEGPVTMPASALEDAREVIGYLAHRRMNRNAQHAGLPGSAVCLPQTGRKVVTLIGQNDYESGICPWDETARREHSPWYGSTADALKDLAKVCREKGYMLAYRPHPAMTVDAASLPEGVILCRGGDLFSLLEQSDLTVTLMSQVGYEALLHGRNVLMLGRCQLSGKGCAWERQAGESLESAVSRAMTGGYTNDMRESFLHHVAHVTRDYAYDDLSSRELRYGRAPDKWTTLTDHKEVLG